MHILTRPILEIDLNNLLNNYKSLKALSRHAQAAAVVKDDAYGLHADIVAKKLYEEGGCRHFFVAHGIEGERIRNLVPEAAIYVLQGIGEDSVDSFRRCRLIPVIGSPEMFAWWKENRIEGIKPVIQVETGLNRLGFRETDLEKLSDADKNEFSMILSHLACADAKEHFMNQHQLDNFRRLKEKYFPKLPASLSASDGTFLGAEYQWDLVRLGAAMYGINTAPYRENQMKSVVTVKAPVLQIADLPKGDFVGYSATYRATENRRLAIVSIGYGDGIPRSLSNVGKVFSTSAAKSTKRAFSGGCRWTTSSATLPELTTCRSAIWPALLPTIIRWTTWGGTPAPSAMRFYPVSAKIRVIYGLISARKKPEP